MTIGLLTESKSYTGKYFFKRLFGIRTYEKITSPLNPFDLIAEILPYPFSRLEKMSCIRLKKILGKKVKMFAKLGITKLVLSDRLYKLCKLKQIDTSHFANGNGKRIFLLLMPLCVRQVSKSAGIDLFSANVCISDFKLDRISEYLLRGLCFDTKRICLCTTNQSAAQQLCERFCDETGLWVDIRSNMDCSCDILLDVDECEVKIGHDLFVRDAKYDFFFSDYDICHTDIASLLNVSELSPVGWIYSYQKK